MFLELRLKNVKKHTDLHVNFDGGVNAIQGPNYKGKTTLLYGCLLALFGPTPLPGKASDIATAGSNGRWVAALTFMVEGRLLRAERTGSTASLTEIGLKGVEDRLIASGPSVVTAEIEKLFGMTAKRFCELRYAEQKKAEVMLTLGVADVNRIIEEVGGVDIVNRVIKACSARSSTLEGKLEGLQMDPELLSTQMTTVGELEQHPALQPQWVADMEALFTKAETHAAEMTANNAAISDLRAQQQAHQTWRTKLADAKGRLAGTQDELTRANNAHAAAVNAAEVANAGNATARLEKTVLDLSGDAEEAATAIAAMRDLTTRHTTAVSDLATARTKLSTAEASLAALPDMLDLTTLQAREATRAGKSEMLAVKRAELTQKKSALQDGFCTSCRRPFEGMDDAHADELRVQVTALEAEIPALDREVAQLTTDNRKAAEAAAAFAKHTNDVTLYTEAVTAAEAKVQDAVSGKESLIEALGLPANTTLANLQEISAGISQQLQDARREIEAIARVAAEIPRTAEAIRAVHVRLEAAEVVVADVQSAEPACPADVASVLAEMEAKAERITTTRFGTYNEAQSKQAQRNSTLEVLASERRLLDSYHRRVEDARLVAVDLDRLKALAKYLKDNRDRFMGELWDGIMAYAQNFASACTGGAIEDVKREADGSFSYTEGGHTFSVKGCASGAQKSIMGLGVQFALAEMLPTSMQTVLLDEPSADMDAEHSAALAALLRSTGKQVILVSHREMDAAVADHVIAL